LLETIRDLRDDFEIEGDQHALATTSGIPGVAIEIVGADFDGALFAFVAVPPEGVTLKRGVPSSIGIQVVVEGPPESLTNRVGEIGQMLASIQVDFSGSGQEEGS
jgi:hypothetical protein